jgi:hypothetical protein
MSAENGGLGPRVSAKPNIASAAAAPSTAAGMTPRFLSWKRYGFVSMRDQHRPNTKQDEISTKRIPEDHDGTEFRA